ncbi:MAG: type VI secretion system-associated protein TagF [Polyangiaceae bacterium]
MSSADWGNPILLGKLPSRGDFVNLGGGGSLQGELDAFLTDGVEWANERRGSSWHDSYERSGLQAFVFGARGDRGGPSFCAGVLAPSRDAAGRRFPVCVAFPFAPSAALTAAPEVIPLALEAHWQAASELVADLVADPMLDAARRLEALRVPDDAPVDEASASYRQWTQELQLQELWSLLLPEQTQRKPADLLYLVTETVRPCRGSERPTTPLSLRLPLGAAGGAALCFWLDWVRRVARWKATIPNFFWSHDGHGGATLLNLGLSPKSTLSELWAPTGERDEICDLTGTGSETSAIPASLAAGWQAWVEAPGRSVAELLDSTQSFEF